MVNERNQKKNTSLNQQQAEPAEPELESDFDVSDDEEGNYMFNVSCDAEDINFV